MRNNITSCAFYSPKKSMLCMSFALEITNVQFSWSRKAVPVIDIPVWQIRSGARVFLYGPSGCGKSTLLNLLCGIATPDHGEINIHGTDICMLGSRHRDRFRATRIGIIFQKFNLLPYLSVADNIRLGLTFGRKAQPFHKRDVSARIAGMTERLGLPQSCLHRRADRLSFGQQQRVAIARVLIAAPAIILADEPTSGLDIDARDDFITTLLAAAQESNSTIVFCSHDHTLAAQFDEQVDLRTLNNACPSS
jgi:putative ABC transport system ATP-binding protein